MKKLVLTFILLTLFSGKHLYSQTFNFERTSPEYVYLSPDSIEVKSHYKITNNLNVVDSLRFIRIAKNLPVGIVSGICDLRVCWGENTTVSVSGWPPGVSQDNIYVYFIDTMGSASGQGTVTYRAERVLNPSEFKVVTFGVTTFPIGIQQISTIVKDFTLSQNYPNPFNPATNIEFSIPKSEYVILKVYDILGREVRQLVSQNLTAGEYKVDFDAKGLSSGMYYYSLRAGENVSVKKMVLVK